MDKVLGMLGMAKRAGKVISGSFLCEKAVRNQQSALILVATDMSENAKQDMIRLCGHHGVQYIEYADKEALGRSVGAGERAVISVNDRNFADAVLAKYAKAE